MDCSTQRQVERQASRLSEMINQLNVDRGKLVRCGAGAAIVEARRKCLNCNCTRVPGMARCAPARQRRALFLSGSVAVRSLPVITAGLADLVSECPSLR
ncbi:hypothetical protein HYPDE_33883 [Hyphomicrobium denitrificans 1NES1]|uniref:Uncharacterized protein n=1 Tax=Hyphomicrobium denitrificans 1NES1 TaxID=670307 RepID=N0B4K7_9HYPH|nr:hypothetical protein HYPDE_33883 [Hyphomicrobium denitrificans 1NES1]